MINYLIITALVLWFAFQLRKVTSRELCRVPAVSGKLLGASLALLLGVMMVQAEEEKKELSENLIAITSAEQFTQEVLKSNIPVVVDFYADWCPPCQKMLPIMSKLADEWKGKVKFVKVNVDNNSKLAEKYGVEGIPDIRTFVNGKQMEKYIGYERKEAWDKVVKALVKE